MARSSSLLNLLLGIGVALLCSLSLSAPLEFNKSSDLVKRQNDSLYNIWRSIPGPQMARGDSALGFRIDQSVDNAWGITYLYGCTALLISDPDFVIVAHMQQETAGKRCINDQASLNKWLDTKLQPVVDLYEPTRYTRVDLIYNIYDCRSPSSTGVQSIVTWLSNGDNWNVDRDNIFPRDYAGSSGVGEPGRGQPQGLAAVRWLKPEMVGSTIGRLEVFFNSDTPIRSQRFVKGV